MKFMKILKNVLKFIAYGFLMILVSLCIYTFVMTDIMKKDYVNVFGYTYFTVSTGSMSGTIEINDIIFVKLTDEAEVDDVISFRNPENDIITHRVVQKNGDSYVTQGDVNNVSDDPITSKDIIGKLVLVVSPSFILKSVAVFLILFIFLSLINFDKIFKKYIVDTKGKQEVPEDIFKSGKPVKNEEKSTGKTICIPLSEINKMKLEEDKNSTKKFVVVDYLDEEIDEDETSYQNELLDEILNIIKVRNNFLENSKINKKWVTKFQYIYELAVSSSYNDLEGVRKLIKEPTFEEIFDYDLDKVGLYERLRNRIFDMPLHIFIKLLILSIMYNDEELFDGVFKIMKYKTQLDVKNEFINVNDKYSKKQIKVSIDFIREFVSNYDTKNAFELEKVEKLIKIRNYNK